MTAFLVVQLAAPLASFGDVSGNVERKTLDRPTRSALLGLAGAALGVEREDTEGNAALGDSFSTASQTIEAGRLLRDFHTYESVWRSKVVYGTRARALALGDRNTSITRRDYRSGGFWLAAWAARPGAAITLEALASAFRKPTFVLYLGRKSCSLSLPLAPQLSDHENVAEAFAAYQTEDRTKRGVIAVDDPSILPPSADRHIRRTMQDEPRNRANWQFGSRAEYVFNPGEPLP